MNPFWRLNDEGGSTLESPLTDFTAKRTLAKNPDEFGSYLNSHGVPMATIINYVTENIGVHPRHQRVGGEVPRYEPQPNHSVRRV